MTINIDKNKADFLQLFTSFIHRQGADKLLVWLETSDFFQAPASTRFHLCEPGGLCQHSINVFEQLQAETLSCGKPVDLETVAICGLLHDVCKVNFYTVEMRNKKDANGNWVKVPFYVVEDKLPYGHGEKSVYIISGFMDLSRSEAFAIRWHMGGFDESVKGGSYALSNAFEQYPLALLLHIADLKATYLDEAR